jgi:hypothetical protein
MRESLPSQKQIETRSGEIPAGSYFFPTQDSALSFPAVELRGEFSTGKQSMNAEQILTHLRKQPFEPFRICLSDGSTHEVRHPELAIVRRREVVIALPQIPDRLAERLVYCDPLHATRIEPIDSSVAQD